MTDTVRQKSDFLATGPNDPSALFVTNVTGAITAQDMRDLASSVAFFSLSQPPSPSNGALWWNGTIMQIWNGSDWKPVGNNVNIIGGTNISVSNNADNNTITISDTMATPVQSLNTLTGAVTLGQGTGITITPAGQTLTITSTSTGANPNFLFGNNFHGDVFFNTGNVTVNGSLMGSPPFTSNPGSTPSLNQSIFCGNLTVASGVTLSNNGFKIYCSKICTVNGTIDASGGPGGNAQSLNSSGGVGAGGNNTNELGCGGNGGNGGFNAGVGGNPANNIGYFGTNTIFFGGGVNYNVSVGGNGGMGGNNGATQYAGGNSIPTGYNCAVINCVASDNYLVYRSGNNGATPIVLQGGCGGGGGGGGCGGNGLSGNNAYGGGGGGGGGWIVISANNINITSTGNIYAKGGMGGAGGNVTGSNVNTGGGGGGGGGGGVIVLKYNTMTNSGTPGISANAGLCGPGGSTAGSNAGNAGNSGTNGYIVKYCVANGTYN